MDILLENPFIIVVLIGIISSVFKNFKSQDSSKQQKTKQPKPFLPGQHQEKKPFFELGELQKQFEQKMEEMKPKQEPPPVIFEEVERGRSKERTPTTRPDRAATSRLNQPRPLLATKEVAKTELTRDQLRDAVVWAEILGPPKAKQRQGRSYPR